MHARRLALGLTRKTQCVEQPLRPRHGSALFSSSSTAASGPTQFYQNRQLELYAGRETKRLTLRQLVFFGRSMNEERLITSANYVRTELPVRIAHRIRDLQSLPYVVVTQEGLAKVYELYWTAFEKFRRYPEVTTVEENDEFCHFVRNLLEEHSATIPLLSLGLSLSSPHLSAEQLDSFMRRMLVSRLSRRVLAEHHLALSDQVRGRSRRIPHDDHEGHVGVISTALHVRTCVAKCTRWLDARRSELIAETTPTIQRSWPKIVVDGHMDARLSYIREHLEYVVYELLKNATRATLEQYKDADRMPPINVTIVENQSDVLIRVSDQGGGLNLAEIGSPSNLFSFSHTRNSSRMELSRLDTLRSASSAGTPPEMWFREVSSTEQDPEQDAGVGSHPRMGIGLPLSNIFATYFGGSLELVSLDGWGTDAYLRFPKLGRNLEGIEL